MHKIYNEYISGGTLEWQLHYANHETVDLNLCVSAL